MKKQMNILAGNRTALFCGIAVFCCILIIDSHYIFSWVYFFFNENDKTTGQGIVIEQSQSGEIGNLITRYRIQMSDGSSFDLFGNYKFNLNDTIPLVISKKDKDISL